MAHQLANKLGDNFNAHSGQLTKYVLTDLVTRLNDRKHYNIRAFHSDALTVPHSQTDADFWQNYRYQSVNVGDPRAVSGAELRRRTMDDMSVAVDGGGTDTTFLTMDQMNDLNMYQLNFFAVSSGNEEWTTGSGITLARDSGNRYMNRLSVDLTDGVTRTLTSFYADDLITDFEDQSYFIEMTLPNFPAQADAAHLNLADSYIDFSSTQDFSSGVDSLRFLDSVNNITLGGDTYARWSRDALVNSDPENIVAIRLRLKSVGAMTFRTTAIRLVPGDTLPEELEIDTKRFILARAVPRAGEPEPGSLYGDVYFEQTRPENATLVANFNAGTNPVGNDNTLKVYLRARNGSADRIEVRLNARSTQSRLHIVERVAGVDTTLFSTGINTNILVNGNSYYLVITMQGTSVTASIYNVSTTAGLTLGSLVYTTGAQTVAYAGRGHVGFSFEPYHYDFTLDFLSAQVAEFGHFETVNFGSQTPVVGAQLFTYASQPSSMFHDVDWQEWGDATVAEVEDYIKIERTGLDYQGGVRTGEPLSIGNSEQVYVRGRIWPEGTLNGTYRVAFVDRNDTVVMLKPLTGLLPNQWNDFEIYVGAGILPAAVYFHLQQQGNFDDTFRIQDVTIDHTTVSWEGSANGGTNWQPFLDTVNEQWGGVKFSTMGRQLRLRATLWSDTGWIQGYELIPKYLYPGR